MTDESVGLLVESDGHGDGSREVVQRFAAGVEGLDEGDEFVMRQL